ncbi:HpcH/HpaI aldolase/citrate lyase family protein [Sphingobium aromaticiconvertens]|uniref:HpcH/HpaI aldolase/citrate lyase family protein n=1 Tax=Sphingobium aromaticiconvertens TaxID=365341 RepID=UPI0030175EC2
MTAFPRSWLFTPGSRPDRFAKAVATITDALILDLEDAVAEDNKLQARQNVAAFLETVPVIRQRIAVRINSLRRAIGLEDLIALARLANAPDYILLPKAEDDADFVIAADILTDCGSRAQLLALVESARGVAHAATIAASTPRLAGLMFGAADYAADLGQQVGPFRPDFARATIANAAASGAMPAIDSPCFAIDDSDALEAECSQARAFGFIGKAAIHPAQLEVISHHFHASASERELASRIIAAAPDGVGVLDGKMIDIAMIRWARRMV